MMVTSVRKAKIKCLSFRSNVPISLGGTQFFRAAVMANYKKYDSRVDSLVVETKTFWDPEIEELSEEDKRWVSAELHRNPQLASNIAYERAHTGFTRIITVSVADIERLYQQKVSG